MPTIVASENTIATMRHTRSMSPSPNMDSPAAASHDSKGNSMLTRLSPAPPQLTRGFQMFIDCSAKFPRDIGIEQLTPSVGIRHRQMHILQPKYPEEQDQDQRPVQPRYPQHQRPQLMTRDPDRTEPEGDDRDEEDLVHDACRRPRMLS